jgi:hypothetical protein
MRDIEKQIVLFLRSTGRFDAGETAFIARELLALKAKLYNVEYPTLMARELFPTASDVEPYAENIAYQQFDVYGKAKLVANDATDLPKVDASKKEFQTPVRTLGDAYSFTWLDMQRSAKMRQPLVETRARRARSAIEEGIDDVLAFGDADSGLLGGTNHSVPTITAAAAAWAGATAQQIYDDMANALIRIITNTKGIHRGNTIGLPLASYAIAATKPWNATNATNLTVLQFFLQNNPGVSVVPWYKLDTAGAGGVKRMMVYDKNPDVIEGQVPLDFYEFPPQATGLAMVINCIARVGGVQVRYPKAIEYVDGL